MHARVISGLIRPDNREEAIGIFRDKIVQRAKKQEGFQGALLLADFESNKFHSITFWDTENNMYSGESTMYLVKQLGSVASYFAKPPTTERFEVVVKV
jgi:heme-degrading monooxygenase HmoA